MKMVYVEDDFGCIEVLAVYMQKNNIEIIPFFTVNNFKETFVHNLDLILTDGNLGNGESAIDVLTVQRLYYPETPLWVYSGNHDMLHIFDHSGYKTFKKPCENKKLIDDLVGYKNYLVDKK